MLKLRPSFCLTVTPFSASNETIELNIYRSAVIDDHSYADFNGIHKISKKNSYKTSTEFKHKTKFSIFLYLSFRASQVYNI